MSLAPGSPVHTEKHRGPRNPLPVEQVANRDIRRHAFDALLASDVHRQLRSLRQLFRHREIGDVAADEPGAFHSDQPEWCELDDVLDPAGHLRAGIDRRDRDGRVLGKAQPLVGAQLLTRTEAGDAAQHHTRGALAFGVQVQQRLGEESAVDALPLTEVGGQLQAVVVHSSPAIHWPAIAAATPRITLTTMLAAASHSCRSSASRCVSNIQVENVVYEPTNAVPASSET